MTTDGSVWTWGEDNADQLGNDTTTTTYGPPARVLALSGMTQVAAGGAPPAVCQ